MMLRHKVAVILGSRQAIVWLILNLVDLGLSIIALECGRAVELLPTMGWLLEKPLKSPAYYQASYIWYSLYKMGLAFLVTAFLVWIKKDHLLRWLNIGLAVICLYIAVMLIKTFS